MFIYTIKLYPRKEPFYAPMTFKMVADTETNALAAFVSWINAQHERDVSETHYIVIDEQDEIEI